MRTEEKIKHLTAEVNRYKRQFETSQDLLRMKDRQIASLEAEIEKLTGKTKKLTDRKNIILHPHKEEKPVTPREGWAKK